MIKEIASEKNLKHKISQKSHHGLLQKAEHGLCDVCSVNRVMIRVVVVIVLLNQDQEPPDFDHIQLEELHQAILAEQVEGQGDQAVP